MKQFTIGLAGHIDHGKTSIVHSLTGKNTDNLKEEIKRGMTIDIGFAHMNKTISLIDVPGHEKFIKNMVAGVSSIDCAVLVISADDGIMPQTIEHFEILELLNIKNGIIVINKIDLVDDEWLDLIELEINDFIKESFLEKSTIIRTSTISNKGIDSLKNEIIKLSEYNYNNNDSGIFRMFLDRVFIKKGFGTVVTGTVSSGNAKVGDKLEILPYLKDVKIRALQSHDEKVDMVSIGDRAAINIQSTDKLAIKRGDHLSEKYFFIPSNLIVVKINTLIKSKNKLKNNQRIRLHIGTQEVIGRLFLTGDNLNSHYAGIIKLEKKIICTYGDRFILRSFSPISTIAGGVVLDPSIKGKWKKISLYANSLFNEKTDFDRIRGIIEFDDYHIFTLDLLSKHVGLSKTVLKNHLKNIEDLIYLKSNKDTWLLTLKKYNHIQNIIKDTLNMQHKNNPDKKGFIKEEINSKVNYDLNFLDLFLNKLYEENILKIENDLFSLIDFSIEISGEEKEAIEQMINILNDEGLSTSSIDELCLKIKKDKKFIQKILKIEVSNNNIIFISNNIIITQKNYLKLLDNVYSFFKLNDLMDIKQFKEISNTSRKYAVPLLEFLDKNKVTYRINNGRKINA